MSQCVRSKEMRHINAQWSWTTHRSHIACTLFIRPVCVWERQSVLHSDQFNCSLTEAVRHSEDMNHTWGDVYHHDVWHQLYFNTKKTWALGLHPSLTRGNRKQDIFSPDLKKKNTDFIVLNPEEALSSCPIRTVTCPSAHRRCYKTRLMTAALTGVGHLW